VASFDPTDEAVLLWTRVTPQSAPVELRWALSRDDRLVDVVASGQVEVGPEQDFCAVVEAVGLTPDTGWWYAFATPDDVLSPVGRTRTMPRAIAPRIRLGVASCSRYASGGFAAYRALAERQLDLVVHLGDYIYEDGGADVRAQDPPERLVTLDQYRARYAQHRADPDLQALHAAHPMVAVWDDHDIAGNAWRDGARDHDPAVDGPWIERLRAASQAHEEWLPGRTQRSADDGRLRAWRALSLGGLADLVVLDTRAWARDRQPASAEELGGPAPDGPPGSTRTLLGADQSRFLAERLARPDRPPWAVIANQVMFHPLRVPVPAESFVDQIEDAGFLVVDGEAVNPDQWDGYPQARDQAVAAIGTQGGVVVISGDVHSSWAWEGPARVGEDPAMVELVSPSITSEPLADRLPVPATLVESGLRSFDDDLSYVELSSHGYLLVELDANRVRGEWWYVDPADPASQRFGAGREAPIGVPMRLTEVDEPLPEPAATTPPASTSTTAPLDRKADDDDALPVIAGAGAAALAAVTAAVVALRRRR
jgi:alkaline phosphatase D